MSQELINKLSKMTSRKFYSNKEIEKLMDLSKGIQVHSYLSKIGEFNHETRFLSKSLKMGDSPYQLVIDNKQRNEVNINLVIPKNKITFEHNFKAFILKKYKRGRNRKNGRNKILFIHFKIKKNCKRKWSR